MLSTVRIPKYRHHKASGQAFVQVKNRRHYLGKFGTEAAEERYRRQRGLRGVRLEVIQIGGARHTSIQALQRFFDALTDPGFKPTARICRARTREIAAADEELAKTGI